MHTSILKGYNNFPIGHFVQTRANKASLGDRGHKIWNFIYIFSQIKEFHASLRENSDNSVKWIWVY